MEHQEAIGEERQKATGELVSLLDMHMENPVSFGQREVSPTIELIEEALRIAGSPEKLAAWVRTPIPSLNGQTPFALLKSESEEGRKRVEVVLGRIEHGVY